MEDFYKMYKKCMYKWPCWYVQILCTDNREAFLVHTRMCLKSTHQSPRKLTATQENEHDAVYETSLVNTTHACIPFVQQIYNSINWYL